MKLSARAEYGVRAMMVLALRHNHHTGFIPLKDIANQEGISFQFLEQIFPLLRKSGLVESARGNMGGYRLAKPPTGVRVGDIIRAVEGPITVIRCGADEVEGKPCCKHADQCVTRNVWERLRDHITIFLDGITLADMAGWSNQKVRGLYREGEKINGS